MPRTPVEEAEELLRKVAAFRALGIDELDAHELAKADANYAEVIALIRKGCPKRLIARIVA